MFKFEGSCNKKAPVMLVILGGLNPFPLISQDTIMASEDATGVKVDDSCYVCCMNWTETHPGQSWQSCCEKFLA